MIYTAPTGMPDMLADEVSYWNSTKQIAFDIFARFGYKPIETPIMEQESLFVRGIGTSTDVVSKEMFAAFTSANLETLVNGGTVKAKNRLALRPEGTAGVVRAAIQNSLAGQGGAPAKLMYAGPMFRAERNQKLRLRQFNQIGVECLGATEPAADAEAIIMMMSFLDEIGLPEEQMVLLINSIGCDECRLAYRDVIKQYIIDNASVLCPTCVERADYNPLRAFDCKCQECVEVMKNAPRITDYLCDDCLAQFNAVKRYLDMMEIDYTEKFSLVRGLDYYTQTVFEVQCIAEGMGNQCAIGGGGRYGKLVTELGGAETPGVGFALGYERCVGALEACGVKRENTTKCDVFVASVNNEVRSQAFSVLMQCRKPV